MSKLTPLHTKDWYIKWAASICLIFATILTSNSIYPLNLVFEGIGLIGWFIVGMIWMDRSLIVMNAITFAVIINSIVIYVLQVN